jgi:CBS domain-containing protein
MAKSVQDVMTSGCECIGEKDSILDAAKRLSELDVGSMPICGEDNKLKGMLTDRDIVVKVLAEGRDPAETTAGDLAEGVPVTIGPDESVNDALNAMAENKVRRLPVLDDKKDLVGILSQADAARHANEEKVGEAVEAISAA